jgi:hypothetical protein
MICYRHLLNMLKDTVKQDITAQRTAITDIDVRWILHELSLEYSAQASKLPVYEFLTF